MLGGLLTSCAVTAHAWADDADDANNERRMNEIVVSGQQVEATDIALDLATLGTQVQVITSTQVEAGGFANFAELANTLIRGANVGYSPDEGEFTIRLDGGSDRDTLLLLDNVPTYDRGTPLEDIWGATALDPRMVDTVEVYRGGQSLYFGGNGGIGVVDVKYKKPDGERKGEIGFSGGSFNTREIWGNYTFPLDEKGDHSLMLFGRSYATDANEIFPDWSFTDNILELGGNHEYPLNFNDLGVKYLWKISDKTELRLNGQYVQIEFRDAFPNTTVYAPNTVEYPIYDASLVHEWTDKIKTEINAYYTEPQLYNTELVPALCKIPSNILNPSTGKKFTLASDYETYAAANGLPTGCVTNPSGTGDDEMDVRYDENGNLLGTTTNPIRIGDPIGTTIDSTYLRKLTKGFGSTNQARAGYRDYGINARTTVEWNQYLETVIGLQRTAYSDASDAVFQVSDEEFSSSGIYLDVRPKLSFSPGTNMSFAVRQDFNDGFDDMFIWKFGLRQELPGGFYARANGGTSYSNPRLSELGTRVGTLGNDTLETEETETLNLGLGLNRTFGDKRINLDVGYFDTTITNYIASAKLDDLVGIVPQSVFDEAASLGLEPTEVSVSYNQDREQPIKGFTVDFDMDVSEKLSFNLTYNKQEAEEDDSRYNETNPIQGVSKTRQISERPEWFVSGTVTYRPTDRWTVTLMPRLQGPEWAYASTTAAKILDANGNRAVPDVNFGDYFVLNGSVQWMLGKEHQHRLMLRVVNMLDEEYAERYGIATQYYSKAYTRGEIGTSSAAYYKPYPFLGKPRSVFVEFSTKF